MGGGYIKIDRNRTVLLSDVVAVVAKKGKKGKSRVVLKKDHCHSGTSTKKIIERLRAW